MPPELPPVLPPLGSLNQTATVDRTDSDDTVNGFTPTLGIRSVRHGCWLVNFQPVGSPLVAYDGTIRVEVNTGGRTASGDLYQRPIIMLPPQPGHPSGVTVLGPRPSPAGGIPIQPLNRYRYYLSITNILENTTTGNSFQLGFQRWRYILPSPANRNGSWVNEGSFSANMTWISAPAGSGYPSSGDYLEGDTKNAAGAVVGRLKMGWVASYYRKASIEIDTVSGSDRPLDNGAGENWATIGSKIGWNLTVFPSQINVTEVSGPSWSNGELHAAMLRWRDQSNLNVEWRYHILAVQFLDATERGIMYDAGATDSNKVSREGVGMSSHYIPQSGFGLVNGKRWGGEKAPYFRTAVHEVGHAFGLLHNLSNQYFMDTSDQIAAAGELVPPKFPQNIKWNFAEIDLRRLRHYPDIFVRPGGVPFAAASETTPIISPSDTEIEVPDLKLEVQPLLRVVPLGAPVRVTIKLTNTSSTPIRAPSDISFKSGFVRGYVTDVSGPPRTFSPLVLTDENPINDLQPGESVDAELTLLRGPDGALFPKAGVSDVTVKINWAVGDAVAAVVGKATVMVTCHEDAKHAEAAHKVLATPDAHLVLVLGGDHLEKGIEAIKAALDDSTLRPHFAAIEARRCAQGREPLNLDHAKRLFKERGVIMSDSEKAKLGSLVER
ncbi:hypothetical protein N7471_006896 [Penicillium samsonianum]|uniref:uncharacterized protein n=1 Tax=Penicillium samsonianum TaxID=1882272 RepID=UPI002549B2E0|nr:uncharacterized protein N7471_006896 [Penicillium samsonianum]KAJ6131681.1 hypothetical protein N7471_006896 [Penicillium samsonianum]